MGMEANLRQEDQDAAMNLIQESPWLRDDTYAKKVVEEGKIDSGREFDLGNFLAVREAILKLNHFKETDPTTYDAAVVNSVRPDAEKWLN